ncbi:MAG: 4Fe-4S binding protein, partial [Acidobacteriota bacterium]
LVVHATSAGDGHGAYHAVADTGVLLAAAADLQQALDLALVAHHVAEHALTPAVVLTDRAETARAVQDVLFPEDEFIREYLRDPAEEIESPTPAQELLFGIKRRRIPRWFDPDRPVAHGARLRGEEAAAAASGRRAFFAEHLTELALASIEQHAKLTGRPSGFIRAHRMDRAKQIIVTQGAAVVLAEQVADHLATYEGARLGVLGLTWLRPFPTEAVREALARAELVTVLERVPGDIAGAPPLVREVRSALGRSGPRLLSATFDGHHALDAGDLIALWANMQRGDAARRSVELGVRPPSRRSRFPHREALLQQVRRLYPRIGEASLDRREATGVRPKDTRTVALYVATHHDAAKHFDALAQALGEQPSVHLRGRSEEPEPDLTVARLSLASSPPLDPVPDTPIDLTLIATLDLPGIDPFRNARDNTTVAIATTLSPKDLWRSIPAKWRDRITSHDLRLVRIEGGPAELVAAAPALLAGQDVGEPVIAAESGPPSARETAPTSSDPELPIAIRRFAEDSDAYDSVPRFWGELLQPRLAGETDIAAPEPHLAVGSVPSGTAAAHDMTARRERMPEIDAEKCIGCGHCWTACPDSAIGPLSITTQALLDAAAEQAMIRAHIDDADRDAASKLQRAHKQLAARLDGQLAKSDARVFSAKLLSDAFTWLIDQLGAEGTERAAMQRVLDQIGAEAMRLPATVTASYFHERHAKQRGTGELLLLAINPWNCQGCGGCAAVCPEDAIEVRPARTDTERTIERVRSQWRFWEQLPDTSGASITRSAERADIGPLPAMLLSRHCLLAVTGGDGAEPGSGEKVAARQLVAIVEHERQMRSLAAIERLETISKRLREAIRESLAEATSAEDLGRLADALSSLGGRHATGGELLERMHELGEESRIDTERVEALVEAARDIEQLAWQLGRGRSGAGRARFGLVIAGEMAGAWATRYPRNPFVVPLTVDLAGDGADLALGLAQGLVAERVADVRIARRADLLLENPPGLVARQREIDQLGWDDLTPDERALCLPVFVFAGADALEGAGLAGLSRLLTSKLPVKVLLLDERDLLKERAEPALVALAHRTAFVLSSSIAHHEHLFSGIVAALSFDGPALIHLHAPSPSRDGFATEATVARAREAVAARVHPLLRYDPSEKGVFGLRLSLEGNPSPDDAWVRDPHGNALTPGIWARGETRYQGLSLEPADTRCAEIWAMLRELAGITTPFTEHVEKRAREDVAGEIAAMRADHERQLQEMADEKLRQQAGKLRDRLLQLAGYKPGASAESDS